MDLHADQIQGFFDIPLDQLYAVKVFVNYFHKRKLKNLVVVAPDVGGIKMARAYAKRLGASLAILDKRRISPESAEVIHLLGDVEGKKAVIVDDIIATGGSLIEAINSLRKRGVKDIYAAISHGVLSGNAVEQIEKSSLKELLITDTIPLPSSVKTKKIKVLSVAELLADAIKRIHFEQSVSCLFE
jgi:ribose-phosphate pyrophosphokinase